MILSEVLRKQGFWLIDIMQGVRPHLTEINKILSGNEHKWSEQIRKNKLNDILNHAIKTTVFYKDFTGKPIHELPVVNKNIIRQSTDKFISSDYNDKSLISVVTSGSTGTPFETFRDKRKKIRNYADTIFFAQLAGFEIGHKLIYLKIWAKEKMAGPFKYWLQNIIPVDVIHLNDAQIENLIKKMESDRSTFGMLGYASALEQICKYLDKSNSAKIKAKICSIISMSESLNDYTKETLKKYFGTHAVARYSNLENGILAQQLINEDSKYLVNTASYFVEILKLDSDTPATQGESGRIVVTDLFNYAMPIIRYDTGDIGTYEVDPLRSGLFFLSRVEGRKLDQLYDTKGNLVSSYIMYKNMWKYTEINQYQIIQEGAKEYVFKINTNKNFLREEELVKEFKSFLGNDADFKVEYVVEIPLLSSGKRRKVVNNYKPHICLPAF